MNNPRLLFLFCLLFLSANVSAQSGGVSKPATVPTAEATPKTAREIEAERLVLERRAQAQSLLIQLGTDAGTFNDQRLRARTQARIADALWETDLDRARGLLRNAWE